MTGEYEIIKKHYPTLTEEEIQFIIDNPCVGDHKKKGECNTHPSCAGCTNLNGFIFVRTKSLTVVSKQSGVEE